MTTATPATTTPAKPLSLKQLQAKVERLTKQQASAKANLKTINDDLTQAKQMLKEAKDREKTAKGATAKGATAKNGAH